MTRCMSATPPDALDDWLSELTGGESSMRRLRTKLRTEAALDDDCCPTCQRPPADDAPHTGHLTAAPADRPVDQSADFPTDRPRSPLLARVAAARSRVRR